MPGALRDAGVLTAAEAVRKARVTEHRLAPGPFVWEVRGAQLPAPVRVDRIRIGLAEWAV